MKTFFLISFLIQFLFSYNIFSHSQDFRISSSSYTASIDNHKKIYNFFNPACNTDQMKNVYSVLGSQFNGILENQQLYFSINTILLERIYIGLLRTSIDDIYNTTSAWNDSNQNGNVDLNEIDYDMISTFTHSNIGLLLSKPFYYKDLKFGINTKFDILSMLDEKSFSHSFDLGMIRDFKKLNIGIVFKDFLNQTYWTTGYKNNVKSKLFFGINYDFKNINTSIDIDILSDDYLFGSTYVLNKSLSFLISKTSLEKFNLGFILNYKNYNIGYSYIIPQNTDLGYSQRVLIGISNL